MSLFTSRKFWLSLAVLAVIGAAAGGFASFGPPQLFAKSETPEFCAGCHVMEAQYEAWFHTGSHRRIKCVDCHLPNDQKTRHLAWKGITGMQDVFAFYSGRVPERIRISDHGSGLVQENCMRCHAETVARINEERRCWECHRRLSHTRSGSLKTLAP